MCRLVNLGDFELMNYEPEKWRCTVCGVTHQNAAGDLPCPSRSEMIRAAADQLWELVKTADSAYEAELLAEAAGTVDTVWQSRS